MRTFRYKLLLALALLALAGAAAARAQIVDGVTFSTKFAFTVGGAKLPAGTYTVKPLEGDPNVVKISSADEQTSALFKIRRADELAEPSKGEVMFKKYGNNYVLDAVYEEGSKTGAESISASAGRRSVRRSGRGAPTTVRVPARKTS